MTFFAGVGGVVGPRGFELRHDFGELGLALLRDRPDDVDRADGCADAAAMAGVGVDYELRNTVVDAAGGADIHAILARGAGRADLMNRHGRSAFLCLGFGEELFKKVACESILFQELFLMRLDLKLSIRVGRSERSNRPEVGNGREPRA